MKTLFVTLITSLLFHAAAISQSSEVLTNKSITSLTSAGMSKKVILSKIQSSKCNFTTDTDALIALKKSGVDQDVIDAMVDKMSGTTTKTETTTTTKEDDSKSTTTTTSSDVTVDAGIIAELKKQGSGIYYVDDKNTLTEVEPTVFSQQKSGSNYWASYWTWGFAKSKKVMSVSGGSANIQFKKARPTFYFYFDPENKSLNSQAQGWMASATSPNEFLMIKFNTKVKNARAVTTASSNAYESAAGIDDEFKHEFKFKKVEKGIYQVYFEEDLESGEYGFMYAGASATNGVSSPKVYDYGVKSK